MKLIVLSALTTCMWLSSVTFVMAAASGKAVPAQNGTDNGDMSSDSLDSARGEDQYRPDDGARQSTSSDVKVSECERLLAQGRIGQRGQTRGSEVTLAGRNCDHLFNGSSN